METSNSNLFYLHFSSLSLSRSIKLGQFLWTDDGHVKLNDFNRAEIMLFNEEENEYCPYKTSIGGGVWRAPEEYAGRPLDDKIDVWAMGRCMNRCRFAFVCCRRCVVRID